MRLRHLHNTSIATGPHATGRATPPPATTELVVSADPAFRGDPEQPNPEQLVVVAVSSCRLLSFLAVTARARVQVLEYDDHAEAETPEDDEPIRLTRITLRPRIAVGPGVNDARVLKLAQMAHEQCYIANSLKTEVTVDPKVEVRATGTAD